MFVFLQHCFKELVMDFISIPAGSFTMGSPEKEEGRSDDEKQVPVG